MRSSTVSQARTRRVIVADQTQLQTQAQAEGAPTQTLEGATDPDAIRTQVREYYGARAATRTGCCGGAESKRAAACCGTSAEGEAITLDVVTNYSPDELQGIDADAAEFSLGCGNPTAIAAMQPGEVVLDLGSGGGLDVFLSARQVGPTGFVYGVDMTDEMLDLARRNATKMGVSNVEFRKGHIEEIPLPDNTVDVIISNCVINLSPDKGQTLREAFRVLKPGGRLAISDIVVDGQLDDLPVSEAQVRTALSWAGCIAGALTRDEFKTLLHAAGFEDVQVDVRQRYSLEALGQSVAEATELLPVAVLEQLVDRFTSSLVSAKRPLDTGA